MATCDIYSDNLTLLAQTTTISIAGGRDQRLPFGLAAIGGARRSLLTRYCCDDAVVVYRMRPLSVF